MIRHLRSRAWAAAFIVALAFVAPVRADSAAGPDTATRLLPADTAFYWSMLRNREQLEIITKSKAWAKLVNLPAAKVALQMLDAQLANPDPQTKQVLELLKQSENKELIELLGDAVSDEIFIYGGSSWVDFMRLVSSVSNSIQYGPLLAQIKAENRGKDPGELQARLALHALARDLKLIRIPDLVIGFKTRDVKKAEAQLKRLEVIVNRAIAELPPPIRDGFKRIKVSSTSRSMAALCPGKNCTSRNTKTTTVNSMRS
jgi:hypothetical protein